MRISKLFFVGIFLALILGASFVSANTNMQSKLSSLQAQEAQLLGVNKTLKAKIQEVTEEIAKKKKGIVAGLVVGGVGGVAGAGGALYARNKNAQTRILESEIKTLKEIPNLVDEIMALASALCCGKALNACDLKTNGTVFKDKKSELLVMDVLQLKKMKSDLQRQKKEMDEFIKLIDEMRDLEDQYLAKTGNAVADEAPIAGYEKMDDDDVSWCYANRAEISDIKNNINLLKAEVAPKTEEEDDGCDYANFPNLKKLNILVDDIKKLRVVIESKYEAQVSGEGSEALCSLEEAEKLDCNDDYEKKYRFEEKFKKEKTRLEALKNEYAVRRQAVIATDFNHVDNCILPPTTSLTITVLDSKGKNAKNATVTIAGIPPNSTKRHVYTYNTKPTTGEIKITNKDGTESFSNADITGMTGYDDNAINIKTTTTGLTITALDSKGKNAKNATVTITGATGTKTDNVADKSKNLNDMTDYTDKKTGSQSNNRPAKLKKDANKLTIVVEEQDNGNNFIKNVEVTIANQTKKTNRNGEVTFKPKPANSTNISIKKAGYKTKNSEVTATNFMIVPLKKYPDNFEKLRIFAQNSLNSNAISGAMAKRTNDNSWVSSVKKGKITLHNVSLTQKIKIKADGFKSTTFTAKEAKLVGSDGEITVPLKKKKR